MDSSIDEVSAASSGGVRSRVRFTPPRIHVERIGHRLADVAGADMIVRRPGPESRWQAAARPSSRCRGRRRGGRADPDLDLSAVRSPHQVVPSLR